MNRIENARVVRAKVLEAIERAGANGLALSELRLLVPGVHRSTLHSMLALLRHAGSIYAISRQPVVLNFTAPVPLDEARAQFAARFQALKHEIASAISLGQQCTDKRVGGGAGRPLGATDTKPRRPRARPQQRLEHLQANRTARTLRSDAPPEPEAAPAKAVTITKPAHVVTVICPPVRRPHDELVSTGDSGVGREPGRYSVPPSSWCAGALQAKGGAA